MYKTKQCWRCLRWYSYWHKKDGIHCPACGLIVNKVRKEPPPMRVIFRSIRPMVILKCGYCNRIEAFNLGACSWVCDECYETKLKNKCDMCGEQKPDDEGKWISPHGFWWCDTCEEKFQLEKEND